MPIPKARGHAVVDSQNPEAGGMCDRCGERYPLRSLRWQYEYQGAGLINTRFLVCEVCLDIPNPQLLSPRLPPDPLPVENPRPEPYSLESGGPPGPANPQINPFTQVIPGYAPSPTPPVPTPSNLWNNGGILSLVVVDGYPTSDDGLSPGSVWANGLWVAVVPGETPSPTWPPIYFGEITGTELLNMGGGNLPLTDPANPGQLWNNGGIIAVSI